MATANEGTLINFCDENDNSVQNSIGQNSVVTTTAIDSPPAQTNTKHRGVIQAEYDSGVEDDNHHGKKTLSPDTPSPGGLSPPLQEETEEQINKDADAVVPTIETQAEKPQKEEVQQERPKTVAGSEIKEHTNKSPVAAAARPKTASTTSRLSTAKSTRSTTLTTKKTERHSAPSPIRQAPKAALKTVQSKVGSLDYAAHKPGGGNVKIENRPLNFSSTAKSKVGASENLTHIPGGGDKKVVTQKLEWKAHSKIGSLENAKHKPTGGNVKINEVKMDFTKTAKSKIGSLENATHKPSGGNVKIKTEKIDYTKVAKSKIGSLDNTDHKPGGGNVKITNQKLKIAAASKIGSLPDSAPLTDRSTCSPAPDKQE